jgi:hypothetical protein
MALNISPSRATNVPVMRYATASILRLLLAIAMGFGFAARTPARDCGALVAKRRCECCANPGAQSCCAAPENRAPEPQPAAPSSRPPLQGQPAALPPRTAIVVLPPVTGVIFPAEKIARRASHAGHSFQAVRCIRMV